MQGWWATYGLYADFTTPVSDSQCSFESVQCILTICALNNSPLSARAGFRPFKWKPVQRLMSVLLCPIYKCVYVNFILTLTVLSTVLIQRKGWDLKKNVFSFSTPGVTVALSITTLIRTPGGLKRWNLYSLRKYEAKLCLHWYFYERSEQKYSEIY